MAGACGDVNEARRGNTAFRSPRFSGIIGGRAWPLARSPGESGVRKSLVKKVLVHLLRLGVCVAALWWALHGLSWHDWITLDDAQRLRVVRMDDAGVEVLDAEGASRVLEPEAVPRDVDGDPIIEYGVPTIWRQSNGRLLALSFLIFAPVPVIQAARFVLILRAQDIRMGIWEGVKLTYAGNFFNFVMFGTTGGDLFKAYYATQHTPHKVEAVTAVFLDRVVGLIGIICLAAIAMTFRLDDWRVRQLFLWTLGMLALVALAVAVFYLPGLRQRLRAAERLQWLPGVDKLRRIDQAVLRMREHPRIVLGGLACSAVLQAIAIVSFSLWGQAMGMPANWPSHFAYIGVSLIVASIPVTPMGLGTMEAALILFLRGPFGTKNQIVFLALGIRLIQLGWALLGVLVPLTGAHRPSAERLAELEAELAAGASAEAADRP